MRPPDRPSFAKLWFELIATILVVAGVFGEAGASLELASINSQLRSKTSDLRAKSDQLLALVTEQAGGAATSAQRANDALGEAQKKMKAVAEQADRIGGTLGMALGLINARQVQDRDNLSAELKKRFKGRNVLLESYVGDAEAWGLCTQLLYVAKSAEMVPNDECGRAQFTAPLVSPLSVFSPNADEAYWLSHTISIIGRIGASGVPGGQMLTIFVGVKSPFVIGETDQTRDAERRAAAMKKKRKPSAKP
jgi:hypothetical protein